MDDATEVALKALNEIKSARNASDRTVSLIMAVARSAIEKDRAQRNA